MARAYAPVLKELAPDVLVVGRSEAGAKAFAAETGLNTICGGWADWVDEARTIPEAAIVAVPVEQLADCACALLRLGVRRILLEKPGGIDESAICRVAREADRSGADVRIAYNRRFYEATLAAQRMIEEDGGVLSFHFEFTEMPARVTAHIKEVETLRNWYLANSSHVVDLAFHLGGEPETLDGGVEGGLDWHPDGSRFVGHGRSVEGALFSYHANWDSPGSFRLELATRRRKLVFRPIEKLSVQAQGAFREEPADIDYSLDERFKAGVFRQTSAFLDCSEALKTLPTVQEHAARLGRLLAPARGGLAEVADLQE